MKIPSGTRSRAFARSRFISATAALLVAFSFAQHNPSFADKKVTSEPAADNSHRSARLREATFHSSSLNRDMRYRVILPAGYDSSKTRYPALFLLHGLYGDFMNWSTLTSLVDDVRDMNLIIAMPDAGNSWYVNSVSNPDDKFEDYIVKDFVEEIDTHYRTLPEGNARAIAGLSMGGYAAVKFSLKYPQLFSHVGGISAALDASADLDQRRVDFREGLQKVFGEPGNPARAQNDVFILLSHTDARKLPQYYLDCGADDMFVGVNRRFAARLQELGISYEFHVMPGDHTWKYWDRAIERFLSALSRTAFIGRPAGSRSLHSTVPAAP